MTQQERVKPEKVLDEFRAHNNELKVADIAKNLNCSEATARSKVKKLRIEGHTILPTKEGLMLVDIVNEDNAKRISKTGDWIIGEMVGISVIGKVAKKPLVQVKRVLQLTKEERLHLKGTLLMLTRLIDAANVDEDLK